MYFYLGGVYTADPYLRLFANGTQLAANDDSCGFGSLLTYTITQCGTYSVHQGCFANTACTGTTIVSGVTSYSLYPTIAPTLNSRAPTLNPNTLYTCSPYTATNTNSATRNTVPCTFQVCAGSVLISSCTAQGGRCTADNYLRLYSSTGAQLAANDDSCGLCSQIAYTFTGPCQNVTLQQGCFATGTCTGTVQVVSVATPTAIPSIQPALINTTTIVTTCAPYTASNTNNAQQNTATCQFFACPGQAVLSMCGTGACTVSYFLLYFS